MKGCPNQILKVDKRNWNGKQIFVVVCENYQCKDPCDRERLPTPRERQDWNGS
jgi:hypothetical protein